MRDWLQQAAFTVMIVTLFLDGVYSLGLKYSYNYRGEVKLLYHKSEQCVHSFFKKFLLS